MTDKTIDVKKELYELQKAYAYFMMCEYEEEAEDIRDIGILDVASTDEVYDLDEIYEYTIQASLDLNECKDIYTMTNDHLSFKFIQPTTYESMTYNLRHCGFDEWVSSENGFDYDLATQITTDYISGQSIEILSKKYPMCTIEKQ